MTTERLDDPDALTSRSGFKLAMWILGWLVGTAVFGCLIGLVAATKGASFDWSAGSLGATAFGTTVLAAVTGTFAYATVVDRDRSERVLVAIRKAVRSQKHPGGTISCEITLRNVGLAPANYITLKVESKDSAGVPLLAESTNDHFLSSGEELQVVVDFAIAPDGAVNLPDDIETRVKGVCLNSVSRPQWFLWQRYVWGGTSFLFKTKSW